MSAASVVFLVCVTFASFVGVTSVFNYATVPYWRHWNMRADLKQQAIIFWNDPESACADQHNKMRLRLKTPAFDRCDETAKLARSSPSFDAFVDLMEELQFCSGGECMMFSTNLFGFLGWIFWALVGGTSLVTLAVGSAVVMFLYRRWQSATYAMPLYSEPKQYGAPWARTTPLDKND